jgi:hypothetical protein
MNVREIVIAHLNAGGFDGLCCDGCGCGLDDLMPCEQFDIVDCKPAKRIACKDDGFTRCENCLGSCNEAEKETAYLFIIDEP